MKAKMIFVLFLLLCIGPVLVLAYQSADTPPLPPARAPEQGRQSTHRLQGEIRLPDGALFDRSFTVFAVPLLDLPAPNEFPQLNIVDGQFDADLPPDVYALSLENFDQPMPYFMPLTKIDLRDGDVTGLVITLTSEIPVPFPTTPPDADSISVGDPDAEGYATVSGAAGAVEPLSAVLLVNLSAGTVMTTTADDSGAFTATLYAPPGSSLLVKYDPTGRRVAQAWQDALATEWPDISYLGPLPGAILPVGFGEAGTSFHSVGAWIEEKPNRWAGWAVSGTLQTPDGTLAVQPGQTITVAAHIRVTTAPVITCTDPVTFDVPFHIHLKYLFGPDGRPAPSGIWFNAQLFTPTGLPIEHEVDSEWRALGSDVFTNAACVSAHAFVGSLTRIVQVPADLPEGVYFAEAFVTPQSRPLAAGVPMLPIWYHFSPIASLSILTVGDPATPHIPWILLGDYPVNGHRGVQAFEDVGLFQMPTRVLFPPHTAVIPRLDERTGEPLVYRLEPGSHWIAASERRLPNPPRIPFAFPSGSLTVQVHKPDGSTDTLGPASIRQASVRTPTTPGGDPLDHGTGQVSDLYHLTTTEDAFAYTFDQYGPHVITLEGEVYDVYGNSYPILGTYEIVVARVLDLDPGQLPTTPYEQGDAFMPGLHIFPPVPADVTVQLVQMPDSDPGQAITATVTGQANRFGYFQPPAGTTITLTAPGEFRVDIAALYPDPDGTFWMGTMTWGNVVEGPAAQIEAHGRRGMDHKDDTLDDMPAWFKVFDLPADKVGIEVYYPYFSGDVHWGNEDRQPGDSIHSIITIEDLTGVSETFYDILRDHFSRARNCYRFPPEECNAAGLEKRIAIDEAPLFITTGSGTDPVLAPDEIDLWGYWYGSSERPDVRVREILSEDGMGTAYWRFDDTYGYQIGEPADGDQPGDIKWEFGGAVFRVISETNPINEYAIYSSFWALLPHGCDAFGCARVTPPFQDATGASINGGPIMTLKGKEIDMLFLPKGVRPGDVLEVGDVIAFSGHVGPPLDSRVGVTITSPSNVQHVHTFRANKIGWVYDPSFDFVADEPGRWTVDVAVLHDRPYVGNRVTPASHNSGTVLGTSGQYEFYVVEPGSPHLFVHAPSPGFIAWPEEGIVPIHIRGIVPAGTSAVRYTVHDKGIVMDQGSVTPDAGGMFTVTYDAEALHDDFPMLSLTAHEGRWRGLADEVAINLLAEGSDLRANTVTLIGEEVFVGGEVQRVYLPLVLRQ